MNCQECGMEVSLAEYHPLAACLMFKGCHNSETVRANLVEPPSHVANELRAQPTAWVYPRLYGSGVTFLFSEAQRACDRHNEQDRDEGGNDQREPKPLYESATSGEPDALALLDAARYRWLRLHSYRTSRAEAAIYYGAGYEQECPEFLDRAIDQAMLGIYGDDTTTPGLRITRGPTR